MLTLLLLAGIYGELVVRIHDYVPPGPRLETRAVVQPDGWIIDVPVPALPPPWLRK